MIAGKAAACAIGSPRRTFGGPNHDGCRKYLDKSVSLRVRTYNIDV